MQDTGKAVVSPMQGDAPAKKVVSKKKFLVTQRKKKGNQTKWIKQRKQEKNKPLGKEKLS